MGWRASAAPDGLTAGAPVLVVRGMPKLPTAGVVFAGRRLIDTLAHMAVNTAGLSALACVAVVPVPDDVDAKGRPRDTAIVPSWLFPDAPAGRFVLVQDRGGEARLALPGRAQDPELPLLAAAGLVDNPQAAPMLALVTAAGLGTFASGRGARLDKRFLIYSLASMPLAYRQPGARSNAALSPEMALRIEKAFNVSMDMLLRMQAWYDAAQMRARANEVRVRRYVPA